MKINRLIFETRKLFKRLIWMAGSMVIWNILDRQFPSAVPWVISLLLIGVVMGFLWFCFVIPFRTAMHAASE